MQAWREALRQTRQAAVRYETPLGKQLQVVFGELWMPNGGMRTKVDVRSRWCRSTRWLLMGEVVRINSLLTEIDAISA